MAVALESRLETRTEYRLGEPVAVTCWLRNAGGSDLWVLVWNTFLEGMKGDFLQITRGGERVAYDGPLARRGHPSATSYVRIAAGSSVSGEVDVTSAYAIREPGDYEVSLRLRIHDAFDVQDGDPPRPRSEHEPMELASEPQLLRVTAGGEPVATAGERARSRDPAQAVTTGPADFPDRTPPPIIVGGDGDEQNTIHTSHNWAYTAVLVSVATTTPQMRGGGSYVDWFGEFDTGRLATVNQAFNSVATWMSRKSVTYYLNDPDHECESDWFAYTYYGSSAIYICDAFWSWWYSTPAEQAQTVVHEASHAAAVAGDITYGQSACLQLADDDPDQAVQNADNYGYYALSLWSETPESDNGVWAGDQQMGDMTQQRPSVAASAGTLMLMYRDNNTSRQQLYFRTWTVSSNKWASSSTIYDPQTRGNYKTSVAPAVTQAAGVFYCVYVDGDKDSPTYQDLVCISGGAGGWSLPQTVASSPVTQLSPALAAFDGQLYCVYAPSASAGLQCVVGTIGGSGSVTWSQPALMSPDAPFSTQLDPALGVFQGSLYCAYVGSDGTINFGVNSGSGWSRGAWLSESVTSAGVALAQWSAAPPVFMCLYRSAEPDRNLRYVTSADGINWEMAFRESGNKSSQGPAMVAYGTELFAFYKGSSNSNVYRDQTLPAPQTRPPDVLGGADPPTGSSAPPRTASHARSRSPRAPT